MCLCTHTKACIDKSKKNVTEAFKPHAMSTPAQAGVRY